MQFSHDCSGYAHHGISQCIALGLDPDDQGTINYTDDVSLVSHTHQIAGFSGTLGVIDYMYAYYYGDENGNFMPLEEMLKDLAINGGDRIRVYNQSDWTCAYIQGFDFPCVNCDYDHNRIESMTLLDSINEIYLVLAKCDAKWFIDHHGPYYEQLILQNTGLIRPLNDIQDLKWLLWASPDIQYVYNHMPQLQDFIDSMTVLTPYDDEWPYELQTQ